MNIRTEEEAVAVYTSLLGSDLAEGSHVVARCLVDGGGVLPDDGCIWTVGIKHYNKDNVRLGGSHNYLGPDGKVWTFPSSYSSLDPDIAKTVLFLIYAEGVADQVDPYALVDRVVAVINPRSHAISALVEDAQEGRLRQ